MWSTREIIIFLAGASAFHTLSHIILPFTKILPITVWGITVTPNLNYFVIGLNVLITLGLIIWANRTGKINR
jgi:hypothetical protein